MPGGEFLGGGGMVAMCGQSGRSCVWLVELHSRTHCVLSAIGQFRSISDVNILTGHSISSSHSEHLPPAFTREPASVSAEKTEGGNKDRKGFPVRETQVGGHGKWHQSF